MLLLTRGDLREGAPYDVDGGVEGAGGTWTSYCDSKPESMVLEPGVVREEICWTRHDIHLKAGLVILSLPLKGGVF